MAPSDKGWRGQVGQYPGLPMKVLLKYGASLYIEVWLEHGARAMYLRSWPYPHDAGPRKAKLDQATKFAAELATLLDAPLVTVA